MSGSSKYLLGIDYGDKRVGLALASNIAKIPSPYRTIENDSHLIEKILKIIDDESVGTAVVGLPRSLDGSETEQTRKTQVFITELKQHFSAVEVQDEAGTSAAAKEELQARNDDYTKEEVDALAATYILEDYLREL